MPDLRKAAPVTFVLFWLFSAASFCSSQESPRSMVANANRKSAMYESIVNRNLGDELSVLRQVVAVSDGQVKQIKESMKEAVAADARSIANRIGAGERFVGISPQLSPQMRKQFTNSLRNILSRNKVDLYVADAELREQFHRQAAQATAVVIMDRLLSFSEEQKSAVERVLTKAWRTEWNFIGPAGIAKPAIMMFRRPLIEVSKAGLQEAMTRSQFFALQSVLSLDRTEFANPVSFAQREGEQFKPLMMEELRTLCKLSSEQLRHLEQAADASLTDIVERKQNAYAKLKSSNGRGFSIVEANVIGRPVSVLLWKDESWNQTLKSTLTDAQMNTVRRRNRTRAKAQHAAAMSTMATSLGAPLGLSGTQLDQLADIFIEETHTRLGNSGTIELTEAVAKISESKIESLLSPSQTVQFQEMMEPVRQQMSAINGQDDKNE